MEFHGLCGRLRLDWCCDVSFWPAEGVLIRCRSSETVRSDPSEILQREWRSRPAPDPCCSAPACPDAYIWHTSNTGHEFKWLIPVKKTAESDEDEEEEDADVPAVAVYDAGNQQDEADAHWGRQSYVMNSAVLIWETKHFSHVCVCVWGLSESDVLKLLSYSNSSVFFTVKCTIFWGKSCLKCVSRSVVLFSG